MRKFSASLSLSWNHFLLYHLLIVGKFIVVLSPSNTLYNFRVSPSPGVFSSSPATSTLPPGRTPTVSPAVSRETQAVSPAVSCTTPAVSPAVSRVTLAASLAVTPAVSCATLAVSSGDDR